MQTLGDLKRDLEKDTFETVAGLVGEGLRAVKEEGDEFHSELMELELLNRSLMTRSRTNSPRRRSVVSEAQMKLARLRLQSESRLLD
jgi:hypothetical protein